MAHTFTLSAEHAATRFTTRANKGDASTYSFDLNAVSDDDGAVSAVVWSVESGSAAISNETLAANVAGATVTVPDEGKNRIKLTVTMANRTLILWLTIVTEYDDCVDDYGRCS
jgi:hypothetical protein